MAVNPNIVVLGPYAPRDFQDISTLTTTMTSDAASMAGTTLVAVDPVTVMGNVYLICSTV